MEAVNTIKKFEFESVPAGPLTHRSISIYEHKSLVVHSNLWLIWIMNSYSFSGGSVRPFYINSSSLQADKKFCSKSLDKSMLTASIHGSLAWRPLCGEQIWPLNLTTNVTWTKRINVLLLNVLTWGSLCISVASQTMQCHFTALWYISRSQI